MGDALNLVIGILLLLVGGTVLVRGASAIASGLGISPMVVGLTVVAIGTSSPELVVKMLGALQDQSAIAFGNIVGSNIANLGLVLGAVALITPISIEGQLVRRELPLLILATTVVLVMTLDPTLRGSAAMLDRSDGVILFLLFSIFVYVSVLDVIRQRRDPLLLGAQNLPVPEVEAVRSRDWAFTLAGITGLALGGHLTITSGVALADTLGLPKTVIGIAIVAVGTSLPELVTSVIAALRREADLAVGNVVGSNLFNGLFVLPAGAILAPIPVPMGGVGDVVLSLLFAVALIPVFIIGRSLMGRYSGGTFLLVYAAYLLYRTLTGGPSL